MSGDPERDGAKPRPAPPTGVLGGQGKRPEPAPAETDGRVPKNVFAHTILGLQVPGAAPTSPTPVAPAAASEPEPLRDPSERPAPVPYQRTQGAWGGTVPMPEPNSPPGNRSVERMIAAKPVVEVHAAAKIGTPESREPTGRMPTTASVAAAPSNRPASNRAMPAPPPPSGAPPAMPPQMPVVRSAAPAAPSARAPQPKRDDPSVPRLSLGVEKIPSQQEPSTKLELTGQSQPLQLSLDARDHVEASLRPVASSQQRSMLPWIALGVIVVLGGLAFMLTRGGEEPAPVTPERVEAVPAADAPAAIAPPVTPTPDTAAQAAVPSAPPEATPAPVVAAPIAPTQVAPVTAKPEKKPEPAKAETKHKSRRPKKRAAASSGGPVLKVTPSGESDLEAAARAAERLAEPAEDDEPSAATPPSPDDE